MKQTPDGRHQTPDGRHQSTTPHSGGGGRRLKHNSKHQIPETRHPIPEAKKQLLEITEFIQKHINAEDYELRVAYSDDQHTRFAQNSITQHIAGDSINVDYKCIKDAHPLGRGRGGLIGSARTGQIDEPSLIATIKQAEEIAQNNSPDPDTAKSLEKGECPNIQTFFPSIEKLGTETIIGIIDRCVKFAESKGGQLSGIISKSVYELVYTTGNGFEGYQRYSDIDLSMTLRKDHIETKVSYGNRDFDKIDIDSLLWQLGSQFDALADRQDMDYETIPVILRPQAVQQLFMYMHWLFNRKYADEGLTPFTDQIGKKFLGDKFSVRSAINDPSLPAAPFCENNIHKNIDWIKAGTILAMPTERAWAQKRGYEPSSLFNIIISGEGKTETEMMKMVPRGLIVNNLWYIRLNDMKTADLTGMTRDGVIYFENGEPKYAVNNFRFNEKLPELTRRILATGESLQIDNYAKVPAMLIDGFGFVDKTTF